MAIEILTILLLIIFAAEVAVMEVMEPFFVHWPLLATALFDAGLLTLLTAPPLWIFCSQLSVNQSSGTLKRMLSSDSAGLLYRLLAAMFCIQFLVMLMLPVLFKEEQGTARSFMDAGLTTALVLPVFWKILSRHKNDLRKARRADILSTPVLLYSMLLYMTFLSDMLQEALLPHIAIGGVLQHYILIDAVVTTVIIAPFMWMLVGRPLTLAAQAERARAGALFDQVVDAVITLDLAGQIESVNPAAEAAFGYRSDELAGQEIKVLFADDQQPIQPLLSLFGTASKETGNMILRQVSCKNRQGKALTMNLSLSRVTTRNRQGWLMILHDISKLKDSEQALRESDIRFRHIFEQSDDAIMFLQPETCRLIDINTTCAELFGYSKAVMLRIELAELFQDDGFEKFSRALRAIDREHSAELKNFTGRHRNGTTFNLSMRGRLITFSKVNIIFCSLRNITNRIRLEKESREIQARLIQTNKMTSLGQMVSGVAHEINNPNNFIMANSRLLAATWQDARKVLREYYEEHGDYQLGGIPFSELDKHTPQLFAGIMEGSHRINEIVHNLKNFYRPDQAAGFSEVNLNQIARNSVSMLHHELMVFTRNFQMTLAEELPPIHGNGQQLGQVVLNLLMNACQALPDKDAAVTLTTGYDRERAQVSLSIRDQGCGIKASDQEKILDPFFTTKLDAGGTGLGLSICRSIIAEHRGTLSFESVPGQGSTFTIRFPLPPQTKE